MEPITYNDPIAKSKDIVSENIEQLKALFPEAFSEGRVQLNVLSDLLGEYVETDPERYHLSWSGKANARREAQKTSNGTLRPCKEESVDWDTTQNLYLEGDNLEVLKLLQKSYHGKVKMIYIDPPYNTGKDVVYKDNYNDNLASYLEQTQQVDEAGRRVSTNSESDGRYHSNWLNMMYPRLKLARNLLTDDGVIFSSIDDNEVENLKKVCIEIYGEENFRGLIVRTTGTPTGLGNKGLVNEFDYILCFSKSELFAFNGLELTIDDEKIYDKVDNDGSKYLVRPLRKTGGEDRREDRPSMYYEIESPDGDSVYPIGPMGYESRWRCSKSTYDELKLNNRIEWQKTDKGWTPYQKFSLEGRTKQPSNLWDELEGNKKATREIKEILEGKIFDYPKPVDLLKKCLKISSSSNDIILDFFSGSSTTAHAVIELNAKDNGNRKFIMVQLPELIDEKSEVNNARYTTIAEIGKERIRRVITKIKAEQEAKKQQSQLTLNLDGGEEQVEVPLDLGFKVFKLDSSNIQTWEPDYNDLEKTLWNSVHNIKQERTEEDVLYEVLLKYGLDLTLPIEKQSFDGKDVYTVGAGALFVCLADGVTTKVAEYIGTKKQELKPAVCRVVFKDNGFATDVDKTNVMQTLRQFGIEEVRSI